MRAIELRPGLAYLPDTDILILDGIKVSPQLIQEAWTKEGERKMVLFEESGEIRFLSAKREDDEVFFTLHRSPEDSWLPGRIIEAIRTVELRFFQEACGV